MAAEPTHSLRHRRRDTAARCSVRRPGWLRHPAIPAESCCLPTLTRFTSGRCAGPGHRTQHRDGNVAQVSGCPLAAPRRDEDGALHPVHDGTGAIRSVEPHRLVSWGRKWYLVGWDTERGDWRTFRVDRIQPRTPAGPRFTPRELPGGGDVAAYVARGVSSAGFRFQARVTVHARRRGRRPHQPGRRPRR